MSQLHEMHDLAWTEKGKLLGVSHDGLVKIEGLPEHLRTIFPRGLILQTIKGFSPDVSAAEPVFFAPDAPPQRAFHSLLPQASIELLALKTQLQTLEMPSLKKLALQIIERKLNPQDGDFLPPELQAERQRRAFVLMNPAQFDKPEDENTVNGNTADGDQEELMEEDAPEPEPAAESADADGEDEKKFNFRWHYSNLDEDSRFIRRNAQPQDEIPTYSEVSASPDHLIAHGLLERRAIWSAPSENPDRIPIPVLLTLPPLVEPSPSTATSSSTTKATTTTSF